MMYTDCVRLEMAIKVFAIPPIKRWSLFCNPLLDFAGFVTCFDQQNEVEVTLSVLGL